MKNICLLFVICLVAGKNLFSYDYLNYSSPYISSDYTEAMRMAVKFFGGQRCGDTHNWMLHDHDGLSVKECHTRDAYEGNDVTGGWHDCGDHIKVANTMGYAALCLLVAYDLWPQAFRDTYDREYGPPNSIPDILDEVKVATDFFIKSFPDDNTFVYYVGKGEYDHKRWSPSSTQSGLSVELGGDPRPTTATSSTGGAQAAAYAGALALMAMHYPEETYQNVCKENAIKLYTYAKSHSGNVSIPTFYPSPNSETSDEMGLGAILLFRLTGDEAYKNEAVDYLAGKWESNYPLAWDTFADMLYYYLIKYVDKNVSNGSGGYIRNFLKKNVFTLAIPAGNPSSEGFPYFENRWGTNKLACGSAFASALYHKLLVDEIITDTDENKELSKKFNRRIVDYMLGENEFDHPFIHGYKGDMAHRIHHRNAFGATAEHTTTEEKNTLPLKFASGGLIGGPSDYNSFQNIIEGGDLFKETEGGCDYNGPFIGALANIVAELDPIGIKENKDKNINAFATISVSPFYKAILIHLDLEDKQMVKLCIYDLKGKAVTKTALMNIKNKTYTINMNSSGVYIVNVRGERFSQLAKVNILK